MSSFSLHSRHIYEAMLHLRKSTPFSMYLHHHFTHFHHDLLSVFTGPSQAFWPTRYRRQNLVLERQEERARVTLTPVDNSVLEENKTGHRRCVLLAAALNAGRAAFVGSQIRRSFEAAGLWHYQLRTVVPFKQNVCGLLHVHRLVFFFTLHLRRK